MTLASGSWDRTIRLWDAATGNELRRLQGHRTEVGGVAFGPDGRLLASCQGPGVNRAPDNDICLWDVRTGKVTRRLTGHTWTVYSMVFLPEGKRLASVGGDGIRIWDVDTGQLLRDFVDGAGHSHDIAVSPDGRTLATGSEDQTAHLWEVATGKERLRLSGHQSSVDAVAFSPDGEVLYTGSRDTTGLAWDLTGRLTDGRVVALTPVELRRLWDDMAGPDAMKGYRAVCRLGLAPKESLPWIRDHLRPAPRPDRDRTARLIADLDSGKFPVRQRASAALAKLGDTVASDLRLALRRPRSAEQSRRLEKYLDKLADDGPGPLRACRALEVLERIATAEAKAVLQVLAGGAVEARLTQEARTVLARLAGRSGKRGPRGER
jgi:hypothetical protein